MFAGATILAHLVRGAVAAVLIVWAWLHQSSAPVFAAAPRIHYVGQHLAVVEFDVRPHSVKSQALRLDLRPVRRAGSDRDRIPAPPQLHPHSQVRMQVAIGTEHGNQNSRQSPPL